jgi:outer membrane receptor for ferrienterochelin and colicin
LYLEQQPVRLKPDATECCLACLTDVRRRLPRTGSRAALLPVPEPSNFYQVIGDPALDPEYAHSGQFGGEFIAPQRRARLGVNAFRNDVTDRIESVSLGFVATPAQLADLLAREGLDPSFRPALGRQLLTYRNLFDVVTQGIEVDGGSKYRRGARLRRARPNLSP